MYSFRAFQASSPWWTLETLELAPAFSCFETSLSWNAQWWAVSFPVCVPCFEKAQRWNVLLRSASNEIIPSKLAHAQKEASSLSPCLNVTLQSLKTLINFPKSLTGLLRIWPLHCCEWRALWKGGIIHSNALLVGMLHWTQVHVTLQPDAAGSFSKYETRFVA